MRIGFDAKRAVQNFTGLGNYSRYLIEILYRFYPENEYFLYAPHIRSNPRFNHLLTACPSLSCISPKGLWKKCRSAWRSIGITRSLEKDHITIYHGLSNELPLNIRKAIHTRSIVTIHDLIFLRYPQCYPPIDVSFIHINSGSMSGFQCHSCHQSMYQTGYCTLFRY